MSSGDSTASTSSSDEPSFSASPPHTPARYSKETRAFIWARPQVFVYCLAQSLLYGSYSVSYPETQLASYILVVGYLLLLASREVLVRLANQNRARELFSCCWVATCAFVDGTLWVLNRRAQLISGLDTLGMVGIIVLVLSLIHI